MPIKKENKSLYPKDWKDIRKKILNHANYKCEFCGAKDREKHPITGSIVILTISHLDHDPTNCSDSNLVALCQRCHLRYDLKEHVKNAKETRRKKFL
jgi:5-methylcytosine-specific restriction endonuclease McrA